jgi:hypothetical protein
VDLLPDRKADTLADWLKEHPGVEVISRDRAGAYADGARRGAPEAIQVADRFHLIKNLGDHLKNMFERKNACLVRPSDGVVTLEMPMPMPLQPPSLEGSTDLEEPMTVFEPPSHKVQITKPQNEAEIVDILETLSAQSEPASPLSRKDRLFEHIKTLSKQGLTQSHIARELRISRRTVKKYLKAQQVPRYTPRSARPSKLDLYKPYITTRWREGVCKIVPLFMEIKERGYTGSWGLLAQYLAKFRLDNPPPKSSKVGRGRPAGKGGSDTAQGQSKVKPQPMLSAREASFLMLKDPVDLTEKQQPLLTHLRAFDSEVETAYQLTQEFVRMLRERQGQYLEEWLIRVEQQVKQAQSAELGSFARGIRLDQAAVTAGLTFSYSQGQVEGQVNRLKTIKKVMFGRAKFDLLRARVLHSDAA